MIDVIAVLLFARQKDREIGLRTVGAQHSGTRWCPWLSICQEQILLVARLAARRCRTVRPFRRRAARSQSAPSTCRQSLSLRLVTASSVVRKSVLLSAAHTTEVDALGGVRQRLAGAQILHLQSVLAEAGEIDGISEQVVIVADYERAEARRTCASLASSLRSSRISSGASMLPLRRHWMGYCLPSSVRE